MSNLMAILVITGTFFILSFMSAVIMWRLSTNNKPIVIYKASFWLSAGLSAVIFIGVSLILLIDYNEVFRVMANWGF